MSHENDAFHTTLRREMENGMENVWYGVLRFRNYGAISRVRGLQDDQKWFVLCIEFPSTGRSCPVLVPTRTCSGRQRKKYDIESCQIRFWERPL